MIRRIGICGSIGSGKSYAAALLARERGFAYVSADDVFKGTVLPDPRYRKALTEHLAPAGVTPFVDDVYQASVVGAYLFAAGQGIDMPRLRAVNRMNAPFVRDALLDKLTDKCILEMAVLPDFLYLDELDLQVIVRVRASGDDAVARDVHRVADVTRRIKAYQERRLDVHSIEGHVIDCEAKHADGTRLADAEILTMFDTVLATHD